MRKMTTNKLIWCVDLSSPISARLVPTGWRLKVSIHTGSIYHETAYALSIPNVICPTVVFLHHFHDICRTPIETSHWNGQYMCFDLVNLTLDLDLQTLPRYPSKADWKKICVSGNPTDPTKRGRTLNIFLNIFFLFSMKSCFSLLFLKEKRISSRVIWLRFQRHNYHEIHMMKAFP